MTDLSKQIIKYKDNCVHFTQRTFAEDGIYFGQGDYRVVCECKIHQLVNSSEYTPDYTKYYCPVYCPFYKNRFEEQG